MHFFVFIKTIMSTLCNKNSMECMGSLLRTCTDDGYWSEMLCPRGTECIGTDESVSCKIIENSRSSNLKVKENCEKHKEQDVNSSSILEIPIRLKCKESRPCVKKFETIEFQLVPRQKASADKERSVLLKDKERPVLLKDKSACKS